MEIKGNERDDHTDDGNDITELDSLFAPKSVHEGCCGDAQQEEPDKNHGWNEIGKRLAQIELLLGIGGQCPDDVNETHDEKPE